MKITARSFCVEAAMWHQQVCVQEPGNVDLLGVWWFFTRKSQRTCGRREVQRSVRKQMLLFFLDGKMLLNLRAFKKKYFHRADFFLNYSGSFFFVCLFFLHIMLFKICVPGNVNIGWPVCSFNSQGQLVCLDNRLKCHQKYRNSAG